MANVHGFGDYRNNDRNNNNNNRNNGNPPRGLLSANNSIQGIPGAGNNNQGGDGGEGARFAQDLLQNNPKMKKLFGTEGRKNPRDENFWDMLHYSFCPTFTISSFTFWIIVINTAIYIATLVFGGINMQGQLLEVNIGSWIMQNFALIPPAIRVKFELWRLITPVFLHLSLSHIVTNSFSLVFWGSLIETFLGLKSMIIVYFLSGIGGSLMSTGLNSDNVVGAGASGAILGVTAALIGVLMLNWKALQPLQEIRSMICCMVTMIMLFNFTMMLPSPSPDKNALKVDNFAHLGGFITGLFTSMKFGQCLRKDEQHEKTIRLIGLICALAYAVLMVMMIWVAK